MKSVVYMAWEVGLRMYDVRRKTWGVGRRTYDGGYRMLDLGCGAKHKGDI